MRQQTPNPIEAYSEADGGTGTGRMARSRRRDDEGVGSLGSVFKAAQVFFRSLAALYAIGTLTYVAWAYDRWKNEAATRIDLFFPCFFPVTVAIFIDAYEVISLLFLKRKRPINPVAVCFDVAVAGVGVFCFVAISMSGFQVYQGVTGQQAITEAAAKRAVWAGDVNNVMIFMMVFSLLHAFFILVAAIGGIYLVIIRKRAEKEERIARNQAEMIHFNERQKKRMTARISTQV